MNPIEANGTKILIYMVENEINLAGGKLINEWFGISPQELMMQ